ncbi:MAG: ClbS/DfsB family four-helix bundle protein [Caldilineae bacterium]|nr:MAG: ClbS/DfsB family four-helix bundle protein [Caldilineae bacterium]
MNREELLEKIETARREFDRLYQALPVHALEGPDLANGWSVKDLLGHIAAWEEYLIARLTGREKGPITDAEVDARNEATYRERKDWEWEEVETNARETFAELLAFLRTLPPERLDDPGVGQLIAVNTYEHYAEHRPMLARWARRWQHQRRR